MLIDAYKILAKYERITRLIADTTFQLSDDINEYDPSKTVVNLQHSNNYIMTMFDEDGEIVKQITIPGDLINKIINSSDIVKTINTDYSDWFYADQQKNKLVSYAQNLKHAIDVLAIAEQKKIFDIDDIKILMRMPADKRINHLLWILEKAREKDNVTP